MHAKWSPAATVALHPEPEIYINEEMTQTLTFQEKQDWVNKSLSIIEKKGIPGENGHKKVFQLDPDTQKVRLFYIILWLMEKGRFHLHLNLPIKLLN